MHKRIKTSTAQLHLVNNKTATLNYYILISEPKIDNTTSTSDLYGCEIELIYENGLRQREAEQVINIFSSRRKIEDLVYTLHKNLVTPCTLKDIIYDYISE